jgi:hypothetical protein
MLRSCCPPSPCGRLSRPRTTTRTPTRPTSISRHRALPGRHQQPGAHGALPTFTMIRSTGLAVGCTPTAHPAGTRSLPPATTPTSKSRAWSEPPSNRAASLLLTTQIRQVSGRSRNRGASTTTSLSLYLSVSLARARASGSTARPSHRRVRFTSARDPAPQWSPSFTRPLHQPRSGIPADTDEMFFVRHLLSHGAPWRTTYLQGIDPSEIIDAVRSRRQPTISATARTDPLTTLAFAARRRGGRPCQGTCVDCRSRRRQPRCGSGPRAAQSATRRVSLSPRLALPQGTADAAPISP